MTGVFAKNSATSSQICWSRINTTLKHPAASTASASNTPQKNATRPLRHQPTSQPVCTSTPRSPTACSALVDLLWVEPQPRSNLPIPRLPVPAYLLLRSAVYRQRPQGYALSSTVTLSHPSAYQSSPGCEQLRLPVILSLLVAATHSTEQAHRRCMCSIVTIVDSLCTHCMCVWVWH